MGFSQVSPVEAKYSYSQTCHIANVYTTYLLPRASNARVPECLVVHVLFCGRCAAATSWQASKKHNKPRQKKKSHGCQGASDVHKLVVASYVLELYLCISGGLEPESCKHTSLNLDPRPRSTRANRRATQPPNLRSYFFHANQDPPV